MSTPDEPTPLSPWPFLIADALALSTAFFIGSQAHSPYTTGTVIGIGGLVATGAALTVLPFVINHARKQDALLTERQREIAALAQTVSTCAEQLSIAAGSLHGIAETAAKSVKQAETLPAKLQEKIHEFKEQLNEVSATENEALSQEVNALRAAETERIESVVTTVRKLSGEFARLEAASRKHVNDLSEALTGFTKSAEHAAVEATTSIAALRADSEKSLAEAQTSAVRAIEQAVRQGLAEFDEKLSLFSGRLSAQLEHAVALLPAPIQGASTPRQADAEAALPIAQASTSSSAAPPNVHDESRSRTIEKIARASAPVSSDKAGNESALNAREGEAAFSDSAASELPAPRKKSAPIRRTEAIDEFSLGLDLPDSSSGDNFSQTEAEATTPAAITNDGMTRLAVTAYIGIGNKLFARGEGPGLSWDRGVPLQFVSIGKWRWESAEADAPIKLKLYKNDEQECIALGEIALESGHQRDVTATF